MIPHSEWEQCGAEGTSDLWGLGARSSARSSLPCCTFLAVSVQNWGLAGPLRGGGPGGLTQSPAQAGPKVTLPACGRLFNYRTESELWARAQEKGALCGSPGAALHPAQRPALCSTAQRGWEGWQSLAAHSSLPVLIPAPAC